VSSPVVKVRPARPGDADAWLEMRCDLWPESRAGEHREEAERFFAGRPLREPWEVLLAEDGSGRLLGFVELSVRSHAEGCDGHRVAYLEGWYVRPEARRRGVGRALTCATELWGREQGCPELASDCDPGNRTSAAAHLGVGFEDAGLVRCFRKRIPPAPRNREPRDA
jgi:aminoglycoside 6'-N-acetyltransferase I